MRNIKSKPEKNEGVNKNPSIIISVILIYARNTIMPPSLYCSYGFVSFFQNPFYGVFDLLMVHKVKQCWCSVQVHAACLIIYKPTEPHFLRLVFPVNVKIVSQTIQKCFNDFMSSRKVVILQLGFFS